VSFVDDTNAAVYVFPNEQVTPLELIEKATADAQRWNDLLAANPKMQVSPGLVSLFSIWSSSPCTIG
jgi:hypothetical protein